MSRALKILQAVAESELKGIRNTSTSAQEETDSNKISAEINPDASKFPGDAPLDHVYDISKLVTELDRDLHSVFDPTKFKQVSVVISDEHMNKPLYLGRGDGHGYPLKFLPRHRPDAVYAVVDFDNPVRLPSQGSRPDDESPALESPDLSVISEEERKEPNGIKCVICEEEIPAEMMKRAAKCRHCFCSDCIEKYALNKLQEKEDSFASVVCPKKDCKETLSDEEIFSFIREEVRFKWLTLKNHFRLRKLEARFSALKNVVREFMKTLSEIS